MTEPLREWDLDELTGPSPVSWPDPPLTIADAASAPAVDHDLVRRLRREVAELQARLQHALADGAVAQRAVADANERASANAAKAAAEEEEEKGRKKDRSKLDGRKKAD